MASFGMLRRVVLTRATRRNIPEVGILETNLFTSHSVVMLFAVHYEHKCQDRVGNDFQNMR
jgi:hypothetical protein